MRKLLLIVLAAIASVVTLVVVAPAWASSGDPMVIGSGTLGAFGDPTTRIFAIGSTAGAEGNFFLAYPDGTTVSGSATCLFASGSTAYLTARITGARGPRVAGENWFAGKYIIIGVKDNPLSVPDLLNFSPGFASNPGCGPNSAATPVFPTIKGDFRVSD